MSAFILLLIVLFTFTSGAVFGYALSNRQRRPSPTPMQRDLYDIISGEIRTARMHGQIDGWSLAKRTDSEI